MSVRLRRLQSDYDQIKQALHDHSAIRIRGVSGNPPDRYRIEYSVRGLMETASGEVTERLEHVAEIYLTLAYPRLAPQCRMLTPVFHPNIAPHAICIGDHWAAGEALLQLIIRIGEMLAYQSYNTQSPLNGAAARWVDEHPDLVPTDPRDLMPGVWSTPPQTEAPADDQCQNCHGGDRPLTECAHGHRVCPDCVVACTRCGRTYCLICSVEACDECGRLVCSECRTLCDQCGRTVCNDHIDACEICGKPGCPDCCIECSKCGRKVCLNHVAQCAVCRVALCSEHAHACAVCERTACAEHTAVCSSCGRTVCGQHCDAALGVCLDCSPKPGPAAVAPPPEAEEKFEFRCSSCQSKLRLSSKHYGKQVKCPKCDSITTAW